MREYLLPDKSNFFKANLHAHSTVSDGCLSPTELKDTYKSEGYSIISITDHFKFCNHTDLSDDEFLVINGCELAIVEPGDYEFRFKKCCHLNLFAKNPDIDTLFDYRTEYTPEGINEIISLANESGFLVCCNHPTWSMEDIGTVCEYNGLFGIEIFNTLSMVNGVDEYNVHELDYLLRHGKKIYPIAVDDCHGNLPKSHPYCDMFGGFIIVAADSLDYNTIIKALTDGDFYASCGPEFYEIFIENDIVCLKCSPVREIKMITGTRRTYRTAVSDSSEDYITEAEFSVSRDNKYIRFEITDKNGKKANTRAYFL